MPQTGDLTLQLSDVLGNDLDDTVAIELISASGSSRYRNTEQVRGSLTLTGIDCAPASVYRVLVAPTRYRARSFFMTLRGGGTAVSKLTFPVLPRKVRGIQAPPYSDLPAGVLAILGGTFYGALSSLQKACLLNVATKASAVILSDGRSCLDHLAQVVSVRQDRLFARTHAALEEETSQSPLFRHVSGALHAAHGGYCPTRSFKTKEPHGNLQLTFFRHGETGDDYLVDADIDEARGIEHIFEVVRNTVNGPTNPYDVREILIAGQGLNPGYSFVFT
jgi:hypothetical protein